MIDALLQRKIEKRSQTVRLQGRILFLTEDPALIKRQLAGEDLPGGNDDLRLRRLREPATRDAAGRNGDRLPDRRAEPEDREEGERDDGGGVNRVGERDRSDEQRQRRHRATASDYARSAPAGQFRCSREPRGGIVGEPRDLLRGEQLHSL